MGAVGPLLYPSWFALDTNAREHLSKVLRRCRLLPAVLAASCNGSRSELFKKHNLRVYRLAEGNRGLRLVRIST